MGNLLSFVRSLGDKSVSELDDKFRLFIDFEKDKIENPGEQKVYNIYEIVKLIKDCTQYFGYFQFKWISVTTHILLVTHHQYQVHDLSVKVDAKISESSEALKFLNSYGPGMCVWVGTEPKHSQIYNMDPTVINSPMFLRLSEIF